MPWATPNEVLAIYPTKIDVAPFLTTASVLAQSWLGAAALPPALLMEIERWLAAHLLSLSAGNLARKRVGNTDVTFARGKLGMGLASTFYGQTVLALDPTGILAALGKQRATLYVD